jgi:rhamnosyltransferase
MGSLKSPRRIAIVAHFDAQGQLTPFVRRLLDELLLSVERIVLVSTCLHATEIDALDERIRIIVRENVGYDFYSFRTGVFAIEDLYAYDELVIANDSVLTVDSGGISRAFAQMANANCDVWSMTESWQVTRHLQSYFMVFRKPAFFTKHFQDFWTGVRVLHNKWEIILSYEVGLTQWLLGHDVRIAAAFVPDAAELRTVSSRLKAQYGTVPDADQVVTANPVHYLWDALYARFGIIKSEVLRDDPNGVLGDQLKQLVVDPAALSEIVGEVDRMRRTRRPAEKLDAPVDDAANPVLMKMFSLAAIDPQRLRGEVAVVLHLFHVDLLDDINAYIRNVICTCDIFVSVKSEADHRVVSEYFAQRSTEVFVYLHANVGRDVGPFISLLNTGLLDRYLAVCKIHSKKSTYHTKGDVWRDELLRPLLGSSQCVLRIINGFRRFEDCGIIGPERAYVSDARFWGGNEMRLRTLADEVGIDQASIRLGFFAGTMFWVRPAALSHLRGRNLQLDEFDPEDGQRDATLAHVIERIVTLCVQEAGYFVASTRDPTSALIHERYATQGVTVLPP